MTPEELKELQEKAALWDSLSPTLKQIFVSQIGFGETIQNTSNASSYVGLLEEESKDMVELSSNETVDDNEDYFVNINGRIQTLSDFLSDSEEW